MRSGSTTRPPSTAPQLDALFAQHAKAGCASALDRLGDGLDMLSEPIVGDDVVDEFAESQIAGPDDIVRIFTEQYFFGCEADDPMTALAFDRARNPRGARLPALFASDIGHWDVPDFARVVCEAWELVEKRHLDLSDFRAFTFGNPVALWSRHEPELLRGHDRRGCGRGSPSGLKPAPTGHTTPRPRLPSEQSLRRSRR